jgi:hypothetical protein
MHRCVRPGPVSGRRGNHGYGAGVTVHLHLAGMLVVEICDRIVEFVGCRGDWIESRRRAKAA